ncbi:MAG: Spy/CpxP family protein refolding chaperone [Magnetococcales bacterium]|nr:Spy/CpxP family protein refolding chaperone [Magnetococcales bacterium]
MKSRRGLALSALVWAGIAFSGMGAGAESGVAGHEGHVAAANVAPSVEVNPSGKNMCRKSTQPAPLVQESGRETETGAMAGMDHGAMGGMMSGDTANETGSMTMEMCRGKKGGKCCKKMGGMGSSGAEGSYQVYLGGIRVMDLSQESLAEVLDMLREEIGVGAEQETVWSHFVAAMHAQNRMAREVLTTLAPLADMTALAGLEANLEAQQRLLEAKREALQAFTAVYAVLGTEQKAKAGILLPVAR